MPETPNRAGRPRLLRPLREFLATETGGGAVLVAAAVLAVVWANSPWSGSYARLWAARASVAVAGHRLELDLRHWINEGVMSLFFLVVGLEIKRELTSGHLRNARARVLPILAAAGGMATPALIYLAIAGRADARGWGVPVATDIALALGVVALAGTRVPPSLRVLLLGLAIVDDIAAIIVIAVFYSSGVDPVWLAVAGLALGAVLVVRGLEVQATSVYCGIGLLLWFALHEAALHPTLAGVAMGLLAPSIPRLTNDLIDVEELTDLGSAEAARATALIARSSVSVVEWLQHRLHPWTSYVIVPLFALANAGVPVSASAFGDAFASVVFWGIAAGLIVGKPLGIVLATRIAARMSPASGTVAATSRQLAGVGSAAGVGFTVALFITELAFETTGSRATAKLGVLSASAVAAVVALGLLTTGRHDSDGPRAPRYSQSRWRNRA